MLQCFDAGFYLVINFNIPDVQPGWCRKRLNLFDQKIACCLFGKHWSRTPEAERPRWIAVPEQATFLHYNSLWDVPSHRADTFQASAPGIWRNVVPSGSVDVQRIGPTWSDHTNTRGYAGKTFHPRWSIDNTITSAELRRKKS